MHYDGTFSAAPSSVCGVSLASAWVVDLDNPKLVHQLEERPSGFAACRTFEGHGRIQLDDAIVEVPPASLVILDRPSVRTILPREGKWRFWWFVFECSGPLDAPIRKPIPVSADPCDDHDFDVILKHLVEDSHFNRQMAVATFSLMLRRWLVSWNGNWSVPETHATVSAIIERVYSDVGAGWKVSDLADEFGLTERRLNKLFHQTIGESPKRFLNRVRLLTAEQMLRFGRMGVKEVAEELKFASPSHLANAFSDFFGIPPSQVAGRSRRKRATPVETG